MKKPLQKCCFGNLNLVTQIEVAQELHDVDTIKVDNGLDNTKLIRDAILDQAGVSKTRGQGLSFSKNAV